MSVQDIIDVIKTFFLDFILVILRAMRLIPEEETTTAAE